MTEQEIMDAQAANGEREFYLMKVGLFYHAYGNGAFALARLTGYRVREKTRRGGALPTAGFPADAMGKVEECMRAAGARLQPLSDGGRLYLFAGADGTPDASLVKASMPREGKAGDDAMQAVKHELLAFDVARSTPLEALLLIDRLQRRLREQP